MFLLLTLNILTLFSSVSIVDFEQVNVKNINMLREKHLEVWM